MKKFKIISLFFCSLSCLVHGQTTFETNTDTYAYTVNYKDSGKEYRFRINSSGTIEMQIANGAWGDLLNGNPKNSVGTILSAIKIAADNNRLVAIMKDGGGKKSIWWYCIKKDQADWSKYLIGATSWAIKPGYADWTACAHAEGAWTNITDLRDNSYYNNYRAIKNDNWVAVTKAGYVTVTGKIIPASTTYYPPPEYAIPTVDAADVGDIAVGNWNGVVNTFYVLHKSTNQIKYIDEEVMMNAWQTVPRINTTVTPYPLGTITNVEASNSVVCVTKIENGKVNLYWIRWDFQNSQDLAIADWCEHNWHKVTSPASDVASYRINTHSTGDDAKSGPWPVPATAWGSNWGGFLGYMTQDQIDNYQVAVSLKDASQKKYSFNITSTYDTPVWKIKANDISTIIALLLD